MTHKQLDDSDADNQYIERRANERRLIDAVSELKTIVQNQQTMLTNHTTMLIDHENTLYGNIRYQMPGIVARIMTMGEQIENAESQRKKMLAYLEWAKTLVKYVGPIILLLLGTNNVYVQAITKALFDWITR